MATMMGVEESRQRDMAPLRECGLLQLRCEALPLYQGLQLQRGNA